MISKKYIYNKLSYIFDISYFKYINILFNNDSSRNTVIDLGCGDGAIIKSIAAMFPESNCIGVDYIQSNSSHNNLTLINGDILNFISVTDLSGCSLIIMNDVIEHLDYDQIIEFMNIVIDKMPKGCRLCLQFPNMSSPFGLRNYYGDHTHKTGLTDVKMSFLLSRFKQIEFNFNGVEEPGKFNAISILLSFVYWKFIIKIYGLLLRRSIGWNRYFFFPNLLCVIQKI